MILILSIFLSCASKMNVDYCTAICESAGFKYDSVVVGSGGTLHCSCYVKIRHNEELRICEVPGRKE